MRLREFDEKERLEKANEKLEKYKTAAGADAATADAAGNFARGHTRFKGINRATKKQFANDAKKSQLKEFAPSGDDGDGFGEEILKRLAAQWWNNDEDPRVEQTLMSAGWEIGQDDGYDNGGVFVVQAGDDQGDSYISWPAEDLQMNEGNEWQGNRGNSQAGITDHTFDEAKQYIKGNYPFRKTYNVSRVEPGMRYHTNPEKVANKTQSLVKGIDGALDYLQVKQNPMMSGSTQVTPSIGYSWHTHENPANGIAVLYYEDRGMGNDAITIAAKDQNNLKGAVQVCRDAGVIPTPKVKDQGVAEDWSQKYKKSINCSHPKGFSQKAHCAGKQKHNESIEMEMVCEDCGMCQSHGSLNEIAKGAKDANSVTKCWPGKHAEGTKTGKNGGQVRNCVPNESVAEAQLDELSKDTLRNYVRAQPARIKGPAGLATTDNQKAARIVDPVKGDIRRAMDKYKDPEYGQQRPRLPEDSLAAMRRLAGVTTPLPAAVPNGPRQYRHMPTAVQPR